LGVSHTYKSDTTVGELDELLRGALRRLMAAAKRVQSLAEFREAADGSEIGGPKPTKTPAPATYELVETHVRAEYKRLRLAEFGPRSAGRVRY
jgi:hypothetical protein